MRLAGLGLALLAATAAAEERITHESGLGNPYGVARVSVRFAHRVPDTPLPLLSEKSGRAHYPTLHLATDRRGVDAYFLFRGREPLEVTITCADGTHRTASFLPGRAYVAPLRAEWWRRYTAAARHRARADRSPHHVRSYLLSMLGRRLGLEVPKISYAWHGREDYEQILGLFLGTESIRIAAQRDTFLGRDRSRHIADLPPPEPIAPRAVRYPAFAPQPIEPIALRVPEECFYLRSRRPADVLWFLDLLDEWGGDLRNLVAVRGLDYDLRGRLTRQLAIDPDALAAAPVSEIALLGTDAFLREGASIGLLFRTADPQALARVLAAARRHTPGRERRVEIAGRQVALKEMPGFSVRSFLAEDGEFVLVTTSETIARRFFETARGKGALGAAEEFRYIRSRLPLAREDTLFLYLSDAFFRNIVGPQYRVEMTRRLRAASEIRLAHLARLAARAEGHTDTSLARLRGAFLPEDFGRRPDGTTVVPAPGGGFRDSVRGGYGHFLPIADVSVPKVTRHEASEYRAFARRYRREWQRMDPVAVAVRRTAGAKEDREHVVLDLHITPYARRHYQILRTLVDQPSRQGFPRAPGDVASVSVVHGFAQANLQHYVVGLRDRALPFDPGCAKLQLSWDEIDWYLAGPNPGFLLDPPKTDAEGYAKQFVWWRITENLTVLAPQKETIAAVHPHLTLAEQKRPAHFRLRIGDLGESKLAPFLNASDFVRARRVSAGNTLFLHELTQQLGVSLQGAPQVARLLLDAEPVCPLGGRYVLAGAHWRSTAWRDKIPPDHAAPLLRWFRGLDLEFTITDDTLIVRAAFELQPGVKAARLE
jgi:hypothetical protein